jgi:hypothetical protein
MYPGETVTIKVSNPFYFEKYSIDYTAGQTATVPDTASNLVNALIPSLKGTLYAATRGGPAAPVVAGDECSVESIQAAIPLKKADVTDALNDRYNRCVTAFLDKASGLYQRLQPAVAPDSHPQGTKQRIPPPNQKTLDEIKSQIDDLYNREAALSNAVAAAAKLDDPMAKEPLDPKQSIFVRTWEALVANTDSIAKDLESFASRISDLHNHPINYGTCVTATIPTDNCPVFVIPDPRIQNSRMLTRQVTYAINAINLVQNSQEAIPDPTKKTTVVSITVLYGDSRWEASAGAFFSDLASRSFTPSPVFTNGVITDTKIVESVSYPTIVPFAAANVRLTNDLPLSQWRSAIYWTFAIGINPNTTTSDFGTGPSLSWRGLMFSALWHIGHDVKLTQGLSDSESLGASFGGSIATKTYWRFDRVALGISVRVPAHLQEDSQQIGVRGNSYV